LEKAAAQPPVVVMGEPFGSLLQVCSLLNKHGARYLVVGGYACILHGLVRTTEDVDILIEEDEENYLKVRDALAELPDHAALELSVEDFKDNIVVKVADAVAFALKGCATRGKENPNHNRLLSQTTTPLWRG
jgi:uncharacterized protein (DUF1330 family)